MFACGPRAQCLSPHRRYVCPVAALYNRTRLAEYAKTNGIAIAEMLAMNPKNDPFYIGSEAQTRIATWFATNWRGIAGRRLHLRGIHYVFVARGNVPDWKGGTYLNTDGYWNALVEASKYARYLGLIPFDAIPDHKAPPAVINAYYYEHSESDPDLVDLRRKVVGDITFQPYNVHLTQPYHQEVWIEKSSMQSILEPVCRQFGANLVQGEGQLSVTSVDLFMKRLLEAGDRPGRVYYITDFDPQGDSMPTAIARKIEFFNRTIADKYGLDCKLKWIALTHDQTVEYRLPRTPIKESDMGRTGFEEKYGGGATELDALEALHPGVLARLIGKELRSHFDVDSWNKTVRENRRIENALKEKVEEAVKTLEWDYKSDFEVPEKRDSEPEDDGDGEDWLYDSDREYDDQLAAYKSKGERR